MSDRSPGGSATSDRLPRWVVPGLVVLTALALIPFAFAAKSRASKSPVPRIQIIPDMDQQPRYEAQQANPAFADGRAMRLPVEGTVARGELRADDHFERGQVDGKWAETFPAQAPLTMALLERGRERYGIFCAPCHGLGVGGLTVGGAVEANGIVDVRALELEQPTWVSPTSFHTEEVRGRPVGHLFNTITNGIRTMPAYGPQIPPADRWAIVAYIRALQRSQNARVEDVPRELRESLR
jgi:mono/diheme cytochrome c family protein